MMTSYEKVNYLLRLKKQIERKMLIEALQHLSPLIDINKYRYFGFGSIYFADFILFHKYLNINLLSSIDKEKEDEKRFIFNLPFGFVDFIIANCSYFIQNELNWKDKLFMWLDYDTYIDETILEDVDYVSSKAKPLDIFIVTVEGESHGDSGNFMKLFQEFIPSKYTLKMIKENHTEVLNVILNAVIAEGLKKQLQKLIFLPLFNFEYKDTKKMYTYGGIFCKENKCSDLKKQLSGLNYISFDNKIIKIDCPILTPREKMYLESQIQENGDLNVNALKVVVGIDEDKLDEYKKYYKYYPQFFESIY